MDAIPREVALQLCADIRRENQGIWSGVAAWQCLGCLKFSKGDPAKMCVRGRPDYRGCTLVNTRYAQQLRMTTLRSQ